MVDDVRFEAPPTALLEDHYRFLPEQGMRLRHLAERVVRTPHDSKWRLDSEEQEAAIELAKAFLEAHQANVERLRLVSGRG